MRPSTPCGPQLMTNCCPSSTVLVASQPVKRRFSVALAASNLDHRPWVRLQVDSRLFDWFGLGAGAVLREREGLPAHLPTKLR
jgi:hypothetical protein